MVQASMVMAATSTVQYTESICWLAVWCASLAIAAMMVAAHRLQLAGWGLHSVIVRHQSGTFDVQCFLLSNGCGLQGVNGCAHLFPLHLPQDA